MMTAQGAHDNLPDSYRSEVARTRADHEHGASWLAREAARALGAIAQDDGTPEQRLVWALALARELAQVRPSMAAIANTVAHVWWTATARADSPESQLAALHAAADEVNARWETAVADMTGQVRALVAAHGGAIYTLSRSGSVEGALTTLARERTSDDPLRVIVSESRPGAEGVALARALASAGARVTLAVDAACAALIEEVAVVMVGADSVRDDGSVVNKVGTHVLALVAHAAAKPVFALAESLKITPPSYPLVIEEMEPDELLPDMVTNLAARNIYFDLTPASLVTGVITESGVADVRDIARLAEQAERAYQALMRP